MTTVGNGGTKKIDVVDKEINTTEGKTLRCEHMWHCIGSVYQGRVKESFNPRYLR